MTLMVLFHTQDTTGLLTDLCRNDINVLVSAVYFR